MSVNISMTCSNCGTQVEARLPRLEPNTTLDCPKCGAAVVYDPEKLEKGLENVKEGLEKVKDKLKILG